MTNIIEELDFFVDQLLDNAVREFKATEQYHLLQDKLDLMEKDCESILTLDERAFVMECFNSILDISGQGERHVYRRGLLDGVKVLKWLGVLA